MARQHAAALQTNLVSFNMTVGQREAPHGSACGQESHHLIQSQKFVFNHMHISLDRDRNLSSNLFMLIKRR